MADELRIFPNTQTTLPLKTTWRVCDVRRWVIPLHMRRIGYVLPDSFRAHKDRPRRAER